MSSLAALMIWTAAAAVPPALVQSCARLRAGTDPLWSLESLDLAAGSGVHGQREIMGLFLSRETLPVLALAAPLGLTPDAWQEVVGALRAAGVQRVVRVPLLGDDHGYHGGAIVLQEDVVYRVAGGSWICVGTGGTRPLATGCTVDGPLWWCADPPPAPVGPPPPAPR